MFGVPCPPLLVRRSECGLGFLKCGRPAVGLDRPPRARSAREDTPDPQPIWWCWRPLLVHPAHRRPMFEDGVVLEVRVDRRCLELCWAQGEWHALIMVMSAT